MGWQAFHGVSPAGCPQGCRVGERHRHLRGDAGADIVVLLPDRLTFVGGCVCLWDAEADLVDFALTHCGECPHAARASESERRAG